MSIKNKSNKKKSRKEKPSMKMEKSQQRLTDLPDGEEKNSVKTKIEARRKEASGLKSKINIEARNAMEEVQEILAPCIKCGMCKSLCPVFKTLKKEEISPRGHAIMLNENVLNELVFQCNLCKACENKCPLNLKICDAMKKAREALVLSSNGLKTNEEMIEAIRKTGSPFESGKTNPDKLYCC
jgi:heterodisulfide reductase subunit C